MVSPSLLKSRGERKRVPAKGFVSYKPYLNSFSQSSPMSSVEDDAISVSAITEPLAPSPPPPHGDVAAESAEKDDPLAGLPASNGAGVDHPSQAADSIQDLRAKLAKQVEYYFSDENLPNDKFLLKHIQKDKAGFVPIPVIASFRKVKKLTQDIAVVVDALKESSFLVVSPDEKKVRRLHPLPLSEFKDTNTKLCTVLVENLPEDHSKENLRRIFGQVGNIKSICISNACAAEDIKQNSKAETLISGKLHALVEYETVEAAEKAAVSLNDEKDWRNGLRVQLLQKRMPYGLGRKAWRGSDTDKGSHTRRSAPIIDEENHKTSESHDVTQTISEPRDGDGGNMAKEKDGRRGRNRRSYKQRGNHGIGHGNGAGPVEGAKPPPGPRMPDGTKGFAMGRGRPPVTTQV